MVMGRHQILGDVGHGYLIAAVTSQISVTGPWRIIGIIFAWSAAPQKYRVFIKYCVFFPRILESLPPLPRQHLAAIGCTANRSDCTLALRYSDVGEGGVAVNSEHPVPHEKERKLEMLSLQRHLGVGAVPPSCSHLKGLGMAKMIFFIFLATAERNWIQPSSIRSWSNEGHDLHWTNVILQFAPKRCFAWH